jgi:hypothetical protein
MTRFARLAAAVTAALVLAQPVGAQEVAAEQVGELTPNLFKGIQTFEWTATLLGGSFRSSLPTDGAEALELSLGLGWRYFAMGLRGSMDFMGQASGYGLGALLGPRIPLGQGARLELLADLGMTTFSSDYEADAILVSGKTEGSSKTLPSVGLRSGLTLLRADGRYAITFGGLVRRTNSATVNYQSTTCLLMGATCGTTSRTATYGGTMVGAYLTFSSLRPWKP